MEEAEYRKLAAVEDRMWYFAALHSLVERALAGAIPGSAAVLDAGCGTGGLVRRLAQRHPGWCWTGLDLSPLACALARERTGAEILEGSVTALPFADCVFCAAVCADVLYHVEDDEGALRELHRVLRPGGALVVNVPACRWLWSYHDEAVHGLRRYARDELIAKLAAAGFVDARVRYWNSLALPLIAGRRKLLPRPRGGSDVRLYPGPVEACFRALFSLEQRLLRAGIWLPPFGSSLFAIARKR